MGEFYLYFFECILLSREDGKAGRGEGGTEPSCFVFLSVADYFVVCC